jgi:heterotetrameric sarcosine oxidase gamma subunit
MTDPLAFLSPPGEGAAGGVVLRTPMEHAHRAAGAALIESDGWRIAEYGGGDGAQAWVADVSHTAKLEVRGGREVVDAASPGLEHGQAALDDGVWTLRLTPSRALVLAPFGRLGELRGRLAGAIDMTSVLAAIAIGGPRVRELFARTSALDVRPRSFPDSACMAGSVARCPAVVLNEGGDRFRILVGWELGEYLWETVLDAGAPIGVTAVSASTALREEVTV